MAKSEEAAAPAVTERSAPAAYVSFRTFIGAVDALDHGIPKQIDRTIWRSQSGVVQSQIMMALRFFNLVDADDRPTPALHRFVENKDRRPEYMRALLMYGYRDLIDHDLTKMSPKMLDEALEQYHVSGDTKRKAVTFFLQAAKFAELPMHPLLLGHTRNTARRKRNRVREIGLNVEDQISPMGDAVATHQGSIKTLELKSGGKLTLAISVDVFSMSPEDRHFVFGLIDELQKYEKGAAVA